MSSGSDSAQTTSTSTSIPRRRSSGGILPQFESLQQQKRGSNDARRQSMNDQQVKLGFLAQLFHNNFGKNAK